MRVVSLIPSATEIVCALGFEAALVGRSHECDFPPGVARLPAVTSPKLPGDGTSYEIDRRLKAILQEGLSVYRVDAEHLRALAPDVVVTQSQCEVCAVSLRDVEEALAGWTGGRPRVVSLAPRTLADVWRDVEAVAAALGAPERGGEVVRRLRARVEAIAARADGLPRPRVATVEWIEPLMAAGNWMPELIRLAGGESPFGAAGEHSPWLEPAALVAADPDAVLVVPCGFDLERTRSELPALESLPGWAGLRAVRDGRVYLADGSAFFNRPGPRLVESLEILAEMLHPEAFAFGHEGRGWERRPAAARP